MFKTLEFKVFPCSLASGCVAESLIPKVNFNLLLPSSNLDVTNYQHPLNFTVKADDFYYVNPLLSQVFTLKLREMTVKDYIGILPSWNDRLTVFDVGGQGTHMNYRRNTTQCSPGAATGDNDLCAPYFKFILQSSGDVVYSKRSYPTLAETVGSIGGTSGVIVVVLLLLYGPINARQRKDYMTRKIYSLVGVKEKDLQRSMSVRGPTGEATLSPRGTDAESPAQEPSAARLAWWRCCCCHKKTAAETDWDDKVKNAHERIRDSLDILTIVRNFNLLKVLTHFFFEERHFDLAQYVGLDLWQEETASKRRREKMAAAGDVIDGQEEQRTARKVKISRRVLAEKKRFHQWLDYIRRKHENARPKEPNVRSELTDELDEFYYDNIAKIGQKQVTSVESMAEADNYMNTELRPLTPHQVPMDEEVRHRNVVRDPNDQNLPRAAPGPAIQLGRMSQRSIQLQGLVLDKQGANPHHPYAASHQDEPPANS